MRKIMVILLVLVIVFVMVAGVVGAYDHGTIKHGGLGYWMNHEFDAEWVSLCRTFNADNPVSDFLRTPPRGDAVEILRRHHVVTFLNWSENRYWCEDIREGGGWVFPNVIPDDVLPAYLGAFNDVMPPQEGDDGYDEWKPSSRRQLLDWKDILEAWNEGK